MSLTEFFAGVGRHPLYWIALGFFAFYPVVSAVVWISTALNYYFRREARREAEPEPLEAYPPVSVLIPACCEEKVIGDPDAL